MENKESKLERILEEKDLTWAVSKGYFDICGIETMISACEPPEYDRVIPYGFVDRNTYYHSMNGSEPTKSGGDLIDKEKPNDATHYVLGKRSNFSKKQVNYDGKWVYMFSTPITYLKQGKNYNKEKYENESKYRNDPYLNDW